MSFKSVHQAADDSYIDVFASAVVKNGTQCAAVDLDGRAPVRLLMPAGWAGTAAIVHVDLSDDGTTYRELWNAGTAYTVAVKASQAVRVDPWVFGGCRYVRLVGTTAKGTAAAQSTQGTVGIVARLL